MRTSASCFFLFGFGLCGAAFAADPRGIPEPPLVIYGTVTDGATAQPVTITSVTWQVTEGTESATLSAASTPPSRIVTQSGQSFYLIDVPFDTRTVQTAAGQPLNLPRNGQSLELKSPSPPYALTPFINGRAATIRSIDGTPATGATLSLTNTPETNGRIFRVDLTLPATVTYEQWAASHFPNPAAPVAARTADPDGDGQTNQQEYTAGTDPTNAQSRIFVRTIAPAVGGGFVFTWDSVAGKTYTVERSADMKVWTPLQNTLTGTGSPLSFTDPTPGQLGTQFYRVIVLRP